MNRKMESKEEFKHITLDYFEKNKNTITDKEEDIWDFMATANIESMAYKNLPKDAICIKLNYIISIPD